MTKHALIGGNGFLGSALKARFNIAQKKFYSW